MINGKSLFQGLIWTCKCRKLLQTEPLALIVKKKSLIKRWKNMFVNTKFSPLHHPLLKSHFFGACFKDRTALSHTVLFFTLLLNLTFVFCSEETLSKFNLWRLFRMLLKLLFFFFFPLCEKATGLSWTETAQGAAGNQTQ